MKGLPPAPVDVLRLDQSFDVNGRTLTTGWWLFNPSWASPTDTAFDNAFSSFFFQCVPELLSLMHDGCSATTCRLSVAGQSVIRNAAPNHGVWTGGQADNVALGMKWYTGDRGRKGWALSYIPGVPDRFISNNWQLNQTAWGNLLDSASHLLQYLNSIPAPDGTPCVVGTVHVSSHGAPLGSATFAPFVGVVPTAKVVTIRRRIPSRGGISPLP